MPAHEDARYWHCEKCGATIYTDRGDSIADFHNQSCDSRALHLTDGCQASILHGPGHQSRSRCEMTGEHDTHQALVGGSVLSWHGHEAFSTFFDESPLEV